MNVFLASIALNFVDYLSVHFFKGFHTSVSLLVIPTAANAYDKDKRPWFDAEIRAFQEAGFALRFCELETASQADLETHIRATDGVLVTGGNTFYLAYYAEKIGFARIIKDAVQDGYPYIGSSAGSVLGGNDIAIASHFDDPLKAPDSIKNTSGLRLVDGVVLPHRGNEKFAQKYEETLSAWRGSSETIIGLADNQALVRRGNFQEIISTN